VPKNSNAPLLRIVVGLLASAAAVFALIRSQELATRSGAIDFYQFWLIGQFIDQPGYGDVYAIPVYDRIGTAGMVYAANSPSERLKAAATTNAQIYTHKIEPISTPALYAAFKLVSSGDYETDADRYQLACSLVFAVAVVILARAVRFGWTTSLCALAMTLWWFGPFKVDILDGNVARLQLAGLAMAVGTIAFLPQRAGRAIAGLLLALNVMFKPNVALVAGLIVLVYAFRREWRAALEVLAGMLGGVRSRWLEAEFTSATSGYGFNGSARSSPPAAQAHRCTPSRARTAASRTSSAEPFTSTHRGRCWASR
jgi:hypothetical protein